MIEYIFDLSHEWQDYTRASTDWNTVTHKPEAIRVFIGNLKKDVKDWDEFISGINALTLCETICMCIVEWEYGDIIPLCVKIGAKGIEGCPIMSFLVDELNIEYKLNLESVPIHLRSD